MWLRLGSGKISLRDAKVSDNGVEFILLHCTGTK